MTKQEFIRFLHKEADNATSDKSSLQLLATLIEAEFREYPEIEIETDKRLSDVYEKMREYARKRKDGGGGCCPPDRAVEMAMEMFGVAGKKTAVAADNKIDINILDLLGD